MTSPTNCPECESARVANALERHRKQYSWGTVIECCVWIIFIPVALYILAKRYDQSPDPEELIWLDCRHVWGGEDDGDDDDE